MIILSDTPRILSFFPYAEASKRWSVVFSNDASMRTLSFIFATPNRVMPRISPFSNRSEYPLYDRAIKGDLVSHNIAKKHDMAGVDAHSVFFHDKLHLVDNGTSRGLDTENLSRFDDMVSCSTLANDAFERISKLQ